MEADSIPLDIWERVSRHCTPWTRYCLGFASKEFYEFFRPVKYAKDAKSFSFGIFWFMGKKNRFNPLELMEMDKSGQNPFGFVFGHRLTFHKIRGYSCVFTCRNSDGEDRRLLEWLIIIDDYWRQKRPKCLQYSSFIEDDGSILGAFDPSKYRPTMSPGGALCKTNAHKERAHCGLLDCFTTKNVSIDLERETGYELIHLYLRPIIEDLTLRIEIFVHSAEPCRD